MLLFTLGHSAATWREGDRVHAQAADSRALSQQNHDELGRIAGVDPQRRTSNICGFGPERMPIMETVAKKKSRPVARSSPSSRPKSCLAVPCG